MLGTTHFAPKAKRVIYLFMSGAPSQLDLFDYKPSLGKFFDKDLPESVRMGQRLTTMTSGQKRFPIAPSLFNSLLLVIPVARCGLHDESQNDVDDEHEWNK